MKQWTCPILLVGAALGFAIAQELPCTAEGSAGFALSRLDFCPAGNPKFVLGQLAKARFSDLRGVLEFADIPILQWQELDTFEKNDLAFRGRGRGMFQVGDDQVVEAELMGTGLSMDRGYKLEVCGCEQFTARDKVNFCTGYLIDQAQHELVKLHFKYRNITNNLTC